MCWRPQRNVECAAQLMRMRGLRSCRTSLRADCGRCASGSHKGSGIATKRNLGAKSGRGRSCVPFVPPLSHSRKLYRSPAPAPALAAATAAVPAVTTPPSASVFLGFFYHKASNSFTFASPALPFTCSSNSNLSPTTTPLLSLGKLSSRSRFHFASRRLFYSQQATPRRVPLAIMYEGKWTAPTVRQTFFDYFAERGHTIGTMEPQLTSILHSPLPSMPFQTLGRESTGKTAVHQLIRPSTPQCPPPRSFLTMTRPSSSPMLA